MELAVNTFNKGLLTDTHPMVQGNDTLSNALNATFITQNGNEVILLNDMGNRRVDNAYLPNGYEPVGIKEYGGIIYIAAYNPITNKSLIGSFPSPERKIGVDDPKNGGDYVLANQFSKSKEKFGGFGNSVDFLLNDTVLLPLTHDTSLHAGDKFVVYSDNIVEAKNITNYFNIDEESKKVISPKNKLYTLALGILNSLNEFVDITNTLARWDRLGEKINKLTYTNESSLYLFNDKYFIAIASDDTKFRNTIDDNKLIQERLIGMLIQNANTYAYKLVGPLYLKATLNHVQNFTYNIYGIKNQNKVTLWVVGNYIYNCPDGCNESLSENDDDYITYNTGSPSKDFSFTFETNPTSIIDESDNQEIITSIYDKSLNLYKVTITNKYNISSLPDDNKVKYRVLVKANSESDFYLKGLSDFGTIDISKLGSGELGVKGWRFLNSISNGFTNLTYVLDAYPKYGEEFTDLRICFKELKTKDYDNYSRIESDSTGKAPSNIISLPYVEGTVYNGRNTISFYWDEIDLLSRSVYDAYIIYKNSKDSDWKLLEEENRWFITTELFNSWYDVNNEDYYTVDFCNAGEGTEEIEKYKEKLKEKLTITLNAKANNTLDLKSPTITNNGNYFSITNNDIKFTTKQNIKGINTISPEFLIEDEILYPSDLVISDAANSNLTIDTAITNNKSDINSRIEKYTENSLNESPGITLTTILSNDKKSFSIDYTITDSFLATTKPGTDIEVTNVYDTILNLVKTIYDSAEGIWNRYSGAICDYTEHTGPDDEHHIRVIINAGTSIERWEPNFELYNCVKLITREDDDPIEFFMSEIKGLFFDAMNLNPDNLIFTYIVSTFEGSHIVTKKGEWSNDLKSTKVELYWRGTQNTWAVSKELISQSNGIVSPTNIANIFDKKAVMCCYKTKPSDLNIYIANDYNANKFFKDILEISYKLKYNSSSDIIEKKNYNNQLKFIIKDLDFKSEKISIDILSSEEFLDKVNLALNVTSISNVFIGNGSTLDSNGEPLRPSRVYLLNDNKLYYNSSSKIYVDGESSDAYYFPLYNGLSAGTPKYIKHCGADNDSNTYLNFSGIKSFNISNIS